MAIELFPVGAETRPGGSAGNISAIGVGSTGDVLNADPSSYIQAAGTAIGRWAMADAAVTLYELVSVTVEFDARPAPGFDSFKYGQVEATLIDRNGAVWARSYWQRAADVVNFSPALVEFGSIISWIKVNELQLQLRSVVAPLEVIRWGPSPAQIWEANNARIVVQTVYVGPTTTALTPSGALADNTPTITWSSTIDDLSVEVEATSRVRVFNVAQYSRPGFNPASFPATWDSQQRVAPLHELVTVPLPAGTYRAYIGTYQWVFPGEPWSGRSDFPQVTFPFGIGTLQFGGYSAAPVSFTIVTDAPAIPGPAIKLDAVRDLTENERVLLKEPGVALFPRVTLFSSDGVEIRDLDVTGGSLIIDARSQIRGSLSVTVTDIDLTPAKREDASGEAFPLHPYGSYLHVSCGLATGRTAVTWIGMGVFRITNAKRNSAAGTVVVKAKDFALNLQESRFGYPITRQNWDTVPPTPFTVLAVAQAIISEAGLAYRTPTADSTSVAVNYVNAKADERPPALDGLAGSIDGWEWYFDIDGVCYFGPGPDIENDAVAYVFEDVDDRAGRLVAQIIGRDQELRRDDVYDVVIASDQAGLYIGGAYDSTPDSVIVRSDADPATLYVGAGPFSPGGKPYFVSSPVIGSQPGAESAARTRLPAVALPAESIVAECSPIPDLRPGKMISMARDEGLGLAKWQVAKITFPLTIGPKMQFEALTIADTVTPAS